MPTSRRLRCTPRYRSRPRCCLTLTAPVRPCSAIAEDRATTDPYHEQLAAAAARIRSCSPAEPRIALVLGSGLGELADEICSPVRIPFAELPGHPPASVIGHAGEVVLGKLAGATVAAWRGRLHYYEGRSMREVVYPIRLVAALGAGVVVLTNAAGGLNPALAAGDLMLIRDHINLPGLIGHSPLRGVHDPRDGDRFVSLGSAYDWGLRQLSLGTAAELGIPLYEGVYAMVAGPQYETPAEAQLLQRLGADAVGMSTVPEVLAARQASLRVLALSAITNSVLNPDRELSHAEVLQVADQVRPRLRVLLRGLLTRLSAGPDR